MVTLSMWRPIRTGLAMDSGRILTAGPKPSSSTSEKQRLFNELGLYKVMTERQLEKACREYLAYLAERGYDEARQECLEYWAAHRHPVYRRVARETLAAGPDC